MAIPDYRIYQPAEQVHLIVFNVRTRDIEDYLILLTTDTHIFTHTTRVTAHDRGDELDTGGYVPAGRIIRILKCETVHGDFFTRLNAYAQFFRAISGLFQLLNRTDGTDFCGWSCSDLCIKCR